jgi:hypothetical protein
VGALQEEMAVPLTGSCWESGAFLSGGEFPAIGGLLPPDGDPLMESQLAAVVAGRGPDGQVRTLMCSRGGEGSRCISHCVDPACLIVACSGARRTVAGCAAPESGQHSCAL